MGTHDSQMPEGWHQIKSVLLKEIRVASTFQHCKDAADALFHTRLIGERISEEMRTIHPNENTVRRTPDSEEDREGGEDGSGD